MPKILLALSVVFMLLSAVLGYLNKGKLTESQAATASAQSAASAAQTEVATTKKSLTDANQKLTAETQKVSDMEGQISSKDSEIARITGEITNLTAQITSKDAELTAKTSELEQLKTAATADPIAGTVEIDPNQGAQVAELTAQIEALRSEKAIIGDKLLAAESKTTELSDIVNRQKNAVLARGTEGQVVAVNQAWGFVVIDLGDRSGAVNNAELVVLRSGERIGRVKITSVERSNSIADIISSSVSESQRILPGDRVIYAGN